MASRAGDVMTSTVVSLRACEPVSRTDLLGVYDRPDSQIRDEIMTQLIGSKFLLDSRAFIVTVTAGVVTLRGPVDREPVALSYPARQERRPRRV